MAFPGAIHEGHEHPGLLRPAVVLFVVAAGAALILYPLPAPPGIDLAVVEAPASPPGEVTLEARPRGELKEAALRVVRLGRAGDQIVLLPSEDGDRRLLRFEGNSALRFTVALPAVVDADEVSISALLFPDAPEAYLAEIDERQTVSPHGIARHARADLVVTRSPGGFRVQVGVAP